jgi:hypothetical protein
MTLTHFSLLGLVLNVFVLAAIAAVVYLTIVGIRQGRRRFHAKSAIRRPK